MKTILCLTSLISSLLALAGCSDKEAKPKSVKDGKPQKLEAVEMSIGGKKVDIEIAGTVDEKAKGLMYRDSMEQNHGMLFVYPEDKKMSYYMYNCRFPLDIAFISADGTILQIEQMVPREYLPTRSKKEARYALEMNKGWFEANGVKVGDKLDVKLK
ncbi:MAG: DUF192 domain-containing protein [Planctomycetota bacterium]|jgi:hypothetical protein|nr:DUF192 domain-containing protein [Planctomycetota bacterium]